MTFIRSIWGALALLAVVPEAGVTVTAAVLQPDYARAPAIARVGAAHQAKILCSAVFVSRRDERDVMRWDLRLFRLPARVDVERQRVSVAPGYGFPEVVAIHRPGLGCTVAVDYTLEHLERQPEGLPPRGAASHEARERLWPEGERVYVDESSRGIDLERLDIAVARSFAEPGRGRTRATRAVVVVHRGRIVAERYAPGITQDTPLIGWSMTKSLVNALVGVLVREGKLSLDAPAAVREWQGPGDPRSRVTLNHLLHMTSGLAFVENYEDMLSDTPFMLTGTPDAARFAAGKPLDAEPGKRFRYVSGSPNIVCRIIRDTFGGSLPDYFAFPRRALFDRIGMKSAVIEPDASGTFVGSSYSYATARDWARFGLLYLRDGVWNGERVLPEGWVDYSTTPSPAARRGEYGAYWWLNAGREGHPEDRLYPSLPRDLFLALGYEGQNVIVVPSRDLVLVRLGASDPPTDDGWNPEPLVADVIAALPRSSE